MRFCGDGCFVSCFPGGTHMTTMGFKYRRRSVIQQRRQSELACGKVLFDGTPHALEQQGQDGSVEDAFRALTLERETRESAA